MKHLLNIVILSLTLQASAFGQATFQVVPTPAGTPINGAAGQPGAAAVTRDGSLLVASTSTFPILADRSGVTSINTATSNAAVTVSANGMQSVCFSWAGSVATGTGTFEVSWDSTNGTDGTWGVVEFVDSEAIDAFYTLSGTRSLASTTGPVCIPTTAGVRYARVRVSSTGTGTLPISYTAKVNTNFQKIFWVNPGTTAAALGKAEDQAAANGDVGVAAMLRTNSAMAANAATNNDYAQVQGDELARTVITFAPAGETWQGCGTATASTSDVAIKAGVASNRIYVTSITCSSSDADNATNLNFKDNTTVIAVGGVSQMAAGAAGTFVANFNPPLRGTANTAFNFNTAVSTSSVICCGAGYISVN